MGARRLARLSVLAALAWLAAAGGEARAQKVVITDLYGEADVRDEAGAVTLLVRSALAGGRVAIMPRAELEATLARAQVQPAGPVRRLSIDQLRDLLVSAGATAVVTGEVLRSGAELRATALVLRSGSAIRVHTARAGDGDVAGLADQLARALADDLETTARPRPNTSLGRLRAFVAADAALRAGEVDRAIAALRGADAQAAGRAAAVREVPAAILADARQPLAVRIEAALLAVEPDRALELAAGALRASRADPVGALGAARAHLSRMNVQAAGEALAPLARSTDPAVLAARAEMAHYAEDRALRDQLLAGLVAAAPAAGLPVVDLVAPGGLPPELEQKALAAAAALEPSWLRSAIGARAAAGGVEPARALALVRVSDLDDGDLALVRAAVSAAGAGPEAHRLRAELAILDGQPAAARGAVDAWLAAAPDQAGAHLLLGRLLVQEGKPAEGAVELGRAAQGGIHAAAREQAHALLLAGDAAAANAILAQLADDASVLALVAGALVRLEEGDVAGARGELERALSLSLGNPELLRALVRVSKQRGGVPLGSDLELLAGKLATSAPPATTGRAVEQPRTAPSSGRGPGARPEDGRATGLGWNPLFLLVAGLLVAGAVLWLVLVVRRGTGSVDVTFRSPPGAGDEVFELRLTRSSKRPAIDLPAFRSRMARAGHKVGRRRATMVSGATTFKRVPAGRWHVHLLGAYSIAGETRVLDDKQSTAVHVNRKAATAVSFDLGSAKAELVVRVYNPGGAASGILVSVDEHTRARTDAQGEVRLEVDPGQYVLTVESDALAVSQPVAVLAPTTQRVAVDLDKERRRAAVASDMSIPTDAGELVIERSQTDSRATRGRSQPEALAATQSRPGPQRNVLLSAASLAVGDTIGKYHITGELGRGAMGQVYRARDTKLEREVALKVISDELRNHPVALQLFLDEAKALAQLNHPNIVGVYDQNEEMGITYMVMELVDGQTLEDILLQRGRLSVSEALEIIDQLCAGLAYAHERKVIHRDIKPANIFVTHDRTVKLGDFGLARVMREIAIRRTEIRGTPLYMAPEQVTGTDIDRRADLYAVGCTLFELLTGAPPFTDGDIMFQQLHAAPPRPSSKVGGLPPELDALVLSCLEKDRRARIDSATLIRERLRSVRP